MLKKALNFIKNKPFSNQSEALSKLAPLKKLPHSFLFVHIPKTAGTSFRKSAEILYPTMNDYGKENSQTSDIVKSHWYKQQDMYLLKKYLAKKDRVFSGHFYSEKYINFVDVRHIFSFVRDPLEQVISHYNHHVKHLDYDGTFNDFIILPKHCNIQSRYLNALPIALYGFIGLTANYEESLDFINQSYGLEIEVKQDNVGQEPIQTKSELTPDQIKLIEKYNSEDILLHNQVKAIFRQRVEYQKNQKNWTHSWFYINPQNLLVGYVYYEKCDDAVQLDLFINDELVQKITANQYTGLLPKANLPRERYVGFNVNMNNFKHAIKIELKVQSTGQSVYEKSLKEDNNLA
jgi:hypothetical protein